MTARKPYIYFSALTPTDFHRNRVALCAQSIQCDVCFIRLHTSSRTMVNPSILGPIFASSAKIVHQKEKISSKIAEKIVRSHFGVVMRLLMIALLIAHIFCTTFQSIHNIHRLILCNNVSVVHYVTKRIHSIFYT